MPPAARSSISPAARSPARTWSGSAATARTSARSARWPSYYDLKLSPDGHRLVTNAGEPRADIWVIDVDRDVRTRLTFEGSMNEAPVWSPDGSEIIYAARDTPNERAVDLSPPRGRQRSAPARGPPQRRRRSRIGLT